MPGSKYRPDSTDKKNESCRKSHIRRAIDILTEALSRSDVSHDAGEFSRECFADHSDDVFSELLRNKCNQDSDKRIPCGNVKNSFNNPSNSVNHPLHTQTGKGRENVLMKDSAERAASSFKPSDLYGSAESYNFPSLQPVVMVDKLDNGSSESAAHCALNGDTVATSKTVETRKYFKTERKCFAPCNSRSPGTVNGICNGNYSAHLPRRKSGRMKNATELGKERRLHAFKGRSIEFEGKRDATLLGKRSASKETVLGESSFSKFYRRYMQTIDGATKLDEEKASPAAPIQVNGIREEISVWKEILSASKTTPDICVKRKDSPLKDSCVVKVRRTDENSKILRRGQSCVRRLCEDSPEKCEKAPADVSELQNSQNGPIVNQYDPATEAADVTVEGDQESSVDNRRKSVSFASEVGIRVHLSGDITDSDSESTTDCNAAESTTVSAVSGSTNKTISAECQRASYALSPCLQPVVVVRKLTCDEIRHYTSESHTLRGEIPQLCAERDESIASFGDQNNGRSSEQVCPESENEESLCRTVCPKPAAKLPYTDVDWSSVTNSPQNEGPGQRSCNGEREIIFEKIIRHTGVEDMVSEYGNDEVRSNGVFGNREVVSRDLFTAKGTMLASDNRKCCRNDMCQVATPELIGLENPITSNRCWMNVTLQTLFSMGNFMQSMITAFKDVNIEDNSLISCILTLHYARSLGHQECVYEQARKLSEVLGTLNSDYILNDQQDPSEFILWLFNAFEPALEKYGPSWASGLITENFRFEMEERTCCTGCLNWDVKISSFLILMLDIYVGTSKVWTIEQALDAYTSTKTITRTCCQCGEDKSLVKTAFKSVPRYLIINLKRYSVKEGEVIRDETPVRHPRRLSLGKYSVPNGVTNCAKDVRSVAVASPPKFNIGRKSLRRSIGAYDLISIIHHSGFSVSSGHYVCDVYHGTTDKWYSYNDKMVKEIYEATLCTTKKQKTGYIYVYQNKNS